jgi:peptide/nickel transport system substrate-binding protein
MVGQAITEFGEPAYGGELGVQYWSKVQPWDPHPTFCCRASVFSPPYNSLLQLNPWTFDRFDIWGDLAESWTQDNAEGTVWSFKIKPHATFWDGTRVTAHDVQYSFERGLGMMPDHPDLANEFKNFIKPHYVSSEAVDDSTFTITLNAPWADFLLFMANDLILIVPKTHYEALDARKAGGEDVYLWDSGWKNMMGSGPFKVTATPDNVTQHWEKNPNYWKKDPAGRTLPYLDQMVYHTINDNTAAQAAWEVGQVVATSTRTNGGMTAGQLKELVERSKGSIISYGVPCCPTGYTLNVNREPFDDILVRRAIMRALDREELHQLIWSGMGSLGTTCGSPGPLCMSLEELGALPGHRYLADGTKDPRDIQEAKDLLAEAGYPNGFKTTILSSTTAIGGSAETAIIFKDQMKRMLNIEVELISLEREAFAPAERNGDYDIIVSGTGGMTTPDNYLNQYYRTGEGVSSIPKNPFNWTYSGPEGDLQTLIDQQSATINVADRKAILRKIELITMTIDSHWIMDYVKAWGQIFNADKVGGQMPTQTGYLETKMEQLWILEP